jgi:hypothetical protein
MTGSETASCAAHKKRVTGGIFSNSAVNSDAIVLLQVDKNVA